MGKGLIDACLRDLKRGQMIAVDTRQGVHNKGRKHPRTRELVNFVENLASREGMAINSGGNTKIFLPLTFTKVHVYYLYRQWFESVSTQGKSLNFHVGISRVVRPSPPPFLDASTTMCSHSFSNNV